MSLTMQELAAQLELSIGTVSRALANDQAIAARTRARVAEAAERLGYRHNSAARALITGRTSIIGVHVAAFSSFFVEMALRLERIISDDGFMAVVHATSSPLATWIPDGEIILGSGDPTPDGRTARPRVGSFRHATEDFVGVDLGTPTRAAVAHLARAGCRRIAMLAPDPSPDPTTVGDPLQDRVLAYRLAVAAAGLPDELIALPDASSASARARLCEHARAHGAPDAVLCRSDDAALGAYRAAVDLGLRVPDDLSIIGCDGVGFGDFLPQPLSTIVQPLDERARRYWAFLRARMETPGKAQQGTMLEAELRLKGTSR